MKPVDVKTSTYFNFDKENSKDDPKFEVGDLVRISKYNFLFFLQKGYVSNRSKEVFVIKKVKNTVPWTYVTEIKKKTKQTGKKIKQSLELKM